ncbi:alpha/beta-hydrolase [Testicularia cyperi]|uniref:Alpha/beta-hydrolase n=1 Tax=Testicularia cyperi TaxID=1882483 RepID=A0A317XGR2_9BASI|nr:alpha/beta-hydrolase [Testicularia cyperi]
MKFTAAFVAVAAAAVSMVSAAPLETDNLDYPPAVLRAIEEREVEAMELAKRDNTAPTSPLTSYTQYQFPAQLAQTAYCGQAVGSTVGDATLLWTAGDGRSIPMTYVAYSSSRGIVVAHQGTNTSSFSSILNDADFGLDAADSRLSYLGSDVKIHGGFQDTWLRTADSILAQVKSALTKYPGSAVFTVGHSLGASISLLDALYLKQQLSGTSVTSIGFGLPRTGNVAFANAVDQKLAGYTHINNGRDPVPRLPPAVSYQHASGEIWINPANGLAAVTCPGQENENCIRSVNPLTYNVDDHTGTYFKVHIAGRGANCPAVIS